MIKAPCMGCQERETMCHPKCSKYKEYVKKKAEENSKIREIKKIENMNWDRYVRKCWIKHI